MAGRGADEDPRVHVKCRSAAILQPDFCKLPDNYGGKVPVGCAVAEIVDVGHEAYREGRAENGKNPTPDWKCPAQISLVTVYAGVSLEPHIFTDFH